jgi:hypothetical protein
MAPLMGEERGSRGADLLEKSRVERWRGGLSVAYRLPALSSAGASRAPPCSVSTSRSSVGSRAGAVLHRPGLSGAPRFLWECLTNPTVCPSPGGQKGTGYIISYLGRQSALSPFAFLLNAILHCPLLPPRYQTVFHDHLNNVDVHVSVNYDPDTGNFGIIKLSSYQPPRSPYKP